MCSATMPPEPRVRGVICASFGATGDTADQGVGGRPGHHLRWASANPDSLAELGAVLEQSCVGIRLMINGPAADVAAAAAVAAEHGMLDEEMTLRVDEDELRILVCGHCRTATTVPSRATEVDCQGCHTSLAVTDHFSRRLGGYLGFSAHAEEAP